MARILGPMAVAMMVGWLAATARAQDPDPREAGLTEFTFEDDKVGGSLRSGNGEVLTVRKRRDRESLVRVRTHFIPELLHSIEAL